MVFHCICSSHVATTLLLMLLLQPLRQCCHFCFLIIADFDVILLLPLPLPQIPLLLFYPVLPLSLSMYHRLYC
jgi:hypothetical protein